MPKIIHIIAFSALAFSAAGANVKPSAPGEYIWTYPAVTGAVCGVVAGEAPDYGHMRYEDISWIYEAMAERKDLIDGSRHFCRPITGDLLRVEHGILPLSETNRLVREGMRYTLGMVTPGVTNIISWQVHGTNVVWEQPGDGRNPGVGKRFGSARIEAISSPCSFGEPWVHPDDVFTTSANGWYYDEIEDRIYPPDETNVVVREDVDISYTNVAKSLISMIMTNGTTSVHTNFSPTILSSNVVQIAETNVWHYRNMMDYLSPTNRIAYYNPPLVGFRGRYSRDALTNAYSSIRRGIRFVRETGCDFVTNVMHYAMETVYEGTQFGDIIDEEGYPWPAWVEHNYTTSEGGDLDEGISFGMAYMWDLIHESDKPFGWYLKDNRVSSFSGNGTTGSYKSSTIQYPSSNKIKFSTGILACAESVGGVHRIDSISAFVVCQFELDMTQNGSSYTNLYEKTGSFLFPCGSVGSPCGTNSAEMLEYEITLPDREQMANSLANLCNFTFYNDPGALPLPTMPPDPEAPDPGDIPEGGDYITSVSASTSYNLQIGISSVILDIRLSPLTQIRAKSE